MAQARILVGSDAPGGLPPHNVLDIAAVQGGHRLQLRLSEVKVLVAKVACVPFGAVWGSDASYLRMVAWKRTCLNPCHLCHLCLIAERRLHDNVLINVHVIN